MKKFKNSVILATIACSMLISSNNNEVHAASSPKLNKTTITMKAGQIKKLKVNRTTKKVKWSVNNKKYAVVTATGKKAATVTARKAGTVMVKATVGETTLNCKVKIKKSDFQKKKIGVSVYAVWGTIHWNEIAGADGYCIYKADKEGNKKLVKKIKNGKKTIWHDENFPDVSYGNAGYYVRAYQILDNGVVIYGDMGSNEGVILE